MPKPKFTGVRSNTVLGKIITVYRGRTAVGRIRQIGIVYPDCRLEWVTWKGMKRTDHGRQMPGVHLADITPADIQRVGEKYLIKAYG